MSEYLDHDSMDDEQREQSTESSREEYRRPPYMREQDTKSGTEEAGESTYGYESDRSQGASYSYDSSSRHRYSYQDEREESTSDAGNRYAYDDGESRYRARSGGSGNGPKKKGNGKIIAAVVVAALAVGGLVGGASYAIGNYFNQSSAASLIGSGTTAAQESVQQPGSQAADNTAAAQEGTAAAENKAAENTEAASGNETAAAASGDASIETAVAGETAQAAVKALDVSDVVDVAMPSVVAITTSAIYEDYNSGGFDPFYYYFYGGYGYNGNQGGQSGEYTVTGAGSGIIIGDDGTELWVVTNNHVVAGADTLTISFCDDTTASAQVKGTDENNDLAVVGVQLSDLSDETKKSIKAIQMGDSDSLRLGETVIAIGNALGLGQSVSTGVVSAVNREITTSEGATLTTIQTDAAINPGNSGGALLDANGELIGINVAKDAETEVEGMGYAIPISSAKEIIEKLTTMTPRVAVSEDQFPYMGVQLQDVNSQAATYYNMPEGIMVSSVVENGPAAKAGVLSRDIITAFNGISVKTYDQLTNQLQYYAGGTEVNITVQRLENGQYVEKELTMTLGLKSDYVTETQPANGQQQNNGQQMPNEGQQMPNGGSDQQNGGNGTNWNGFNFGQ